MAKRQVRPSFLLALLCAAASVVISCSNNALPGAPNHGPGSDAGAPNNGPGNDAGSCATSSGHLSVPSEHRAATPAACTPQSPRACTTPGTTGCTADSQCTAGLDGRCTLASSGCACQYDACLTDADCPAGTDCACPYRGVGASACLPSNCRLDSDCGPGGYCSPSYFRGGPGGCGAQWFGWFCHTPHDECGDASDCAADGCGGMSASCVYAKEVGHWKCASFTLCAG